MLDPSKPESLKRFPTGMANAGVLLRKASRLSPQMAKALGIDQHQLEVCGTVLLEVAVQLGAELLPQGHSDLKRIARQAEISDKKATL